MEYFAAATHRLKLRVDVVVFGSWDSEHDPAATGWEMYDQRLIIVGAIIAAAPLDEPHDIAAYTHERLPRRTRRVRGSGPLGPWPLSPDRYSCLERQARSSPVGRSSCAVQSRDRHVKRRGRCR